VPWTEGNVEVRWRIATGQRASSRKYQREAAPAVNRATAATIMVPQIVPKASTERPCGDSGRR